MKNKLIIFCFYTIGAFLFLSCGKSNDGGGNGKGEENVFLQVSKKQFEVDYQAQTVATTVSTNASVTIEESASWCTAQLSKDTQTDNLKISLTENPGEDRTAEILLTAEGGPMAIISVSQKKKGEAGNEDPNDWLEIDVATYNIRGDFAADLETGNNWAVRKDAMISLIGSFSPDVFGTQEGKTLTQLVDIQSALPEYDYVSHPYGAISNPTQSLAIYYKKDFFNLLDKGVFWLSETPDEHSVGWDATDVRICHWAKLQEKSTGKILFFFNTHLYHKNVTARENSGALIVNRIKSIAGDAPVVAVGDFNSKPSESQIRDIQTLLKDSFDMTETTREGPTGTAFPGGVFEGEVNPKSRIDYIFVTDGIRVLSYICSDFSYDNNGNARYPSDHFPLFSKIALPKK